MQNNELLKRVSDMTYEELMNHISELRQAREASVVNDATPAKRKGKREKASTQKKIAGLSEKQKLELLAKLTGGS